MIGSKIAAPTIPVSGFAFGRGVTMPPFVFGRQCLTDAALSQPRSMMSSARRHASWGCPLLTVLPPQLQMRMNSVPGRNSVGG